MRLSRESRWSLALIATAVLATTLYLAHQALRDPDVPFLPRAAEAEWIVFPRLPSPRIRTVAELPATFTREIELAAPPREARLRVRLFRSGTVRINGREVPLSSAPGLHWKRESTADVTAMLSRGKNTIEATARSGAGGPALWLALTVDGETTGSDERFSVSAAGSAIRAARRASVPMDEWGSSGPGSLNGSLRDPKLNPRPLDALGRAWPLILLSGGLSAGAAVALRRFARCRAVELQVRAVVALVAVSAAIGGAVFLRNSQLDPRVGFDATGHIAYVNHLLQRGDVPAADEGWEMYQPPLYYALIAGALKAGGHEKLDASSIAVARCVGWLTLSLQTLFVALGLRILLADRSRAAFVAMAVAAVLPMHLYLYQYVSNEGLAAMLVSASLWLALRILRDDSTRVVDHALLGLALGLAMLAKFSALLAIVLVLGVRIVRLARAQVRTPLVWLRTAGITVAMVVLVCGWHYARVHERFGSFLVGNFDPDAGFDWWQDPGLHTAGDYARFGVSLERPLLSATHSFADALYSTLWGDGLIGGASRLDLRPPWNYDLLAAGMLLALIPSVALVLGLAGALRRLVQEPHAGWFLALGLFAAVLAALTSLTLKLPFYAQAKAIYASSVAIPLCGSIGLGIDGLARRAGRFAPIVWGLLGAWAIASVLAFWSIDRAPMQRVTPSQPDGSAWSVPDAADASRGGPPALERAAATLRENPDVQARLAVVRLESGDVAGAIAACRDAIAANPWSAAGHHACGRSFEAKGELDTALEHFDLAARAAPFSEGFVLGLADFLTGHGRWREAERAVERACARFQATHRPIPSRITDKLRECREHR